MLTPPSIPSEAAVNSPAKCAAILAIALSALALSPNLAEASPGEE